MAFHVLSYQYVNIGPFVHVLYFGPSFMAVRNQSVTVRDLSTTSSVCDHLDVKSNVLSYFSRYDKLK